MDDHPFHVGAHYQNGNGWYEVLAIRPPSMDVRYEDGTNATLTVYVQSRIYHRLHVSISPTDTRYPFPSRISDAEQDIMRRIAPQTRQSGQYTRDAFLTVCRWKTFHRSHDLESNSEADVRRITSLALSPACSQPLQLLEEGLKGVGWARASALLHFGHHDPFPIIDYRALWSAGLNLPDKPGDYSAAYPDYYTKYVAIFGLPAIDDLWDELWSDYIALCRALAAGLDQDPHVAMRLLDRALYQFYETRD